MKPKLSDYLDTDRIVQRATSITSFAMRRWVRGRLLTEEPLLSNLIYEFEDDDPRCMSARVGLVESKAAIRLLHRQGDGNSDLMGSDLAVTLMARGSRGFALKTALFQVKKVYDSSGRVKVERGQINQANHSPITAGKAFVLCADPTKECIRIQSTRDLEGRFRDGADSHQPIPNAENGWLTVSLWTELWMKCEQGEPSEPFDRAGLEAALILRFAEADGVAAIASAMDLAPDRLRTADALAPLSNTAGWLFTSIAVSRGDSDG